ncbi:hypothetical protein QYF61_009152 [Mycteria americana]|uniref:Uncharacterized protein n=1 Tax=Mycteria americana TaxID=33587 RepID=A0AAN7N3S6_MYCAM|nr:hypothetical protein QYF61_009152 [Mycteria americana]
MILLQVSAKDFHLPHAYRKFDNMTPASASSWKDVFQVNHQGSSQYQYRLGIEWIEGSPADKDLGIPVDEKLDMSRQCEPAVQKSSRTLGCIKRSVGSRLREAILSLYCAVVRTPQSTASSSGVPSTRKTWTW